MYLYDKQDNKYDVYSVSGKQEELVEYRKQELESIPDSERILEYKDTDSYWLIGYEKYPTFSASKVHPSSITRDAKESLLTSFYNGEHSSSPIQVVSSKDSLMYLLDTEKKYSRDYQNFRQVINIIQLPRPLYSLQMFEQQRFDHIAEEDITRIARLFSVSKVDEISISELEKIVRYGFAPNVYDNVNKVEQSHNKVLSLIRNNTK